MSSKLFKPLKIGNIQLQTRIVMAPLTRFRADEDHVPLPFVAEYYSQRGSVPGTLLIAEATFIALQAGGYPNIPGIWNDAQIAAWKKVTDAVHANGSFIFLQLWALGRTANADFLNYESRAIVKSSSDVPMKGGVVPTPLTEEEIWGYVGYYKQAAKNAISAGFDGIELHGANGYLIDQFLQDVTNKRTDDWGGSVEKRARFGIEVTRAVVDAIGAERTAIRLSPYSKFKGMGMKNPEVQFGYLVEQLKMLKLAYIHVIEARVDGAVDIESTESVDFLIDIWGKTSPVLLGGGFKAPSAKKAVDEEYKDKDVGIAFGRHFISNPDLVFRIREGIAFTPYDRSKFYNVMEEDGYTTWEFSKEFKAEQTSKL